ncbi:MULTISPECIES: chemotaxis protein CheB [unclassified Luteimonas]|uniref:chemotaxis protein CheB n=1 Tax=unclassified Luteimonas TaxID=2629088 RepID=UPI0016029CE3|nr:MULTISPECIES: chemotaxis protein CheB [unclassified Luteimonas]MBB1473846.1 chemotaxis protein [Luteimonas sp. MC1782]MBB6599923.1 chemotaxis protein [Luteimonas sp. MC1825]QOC87634.1 chemotaxis protein [Luteimonas sp. MC1825]
MPDAASDKIRVLLLARPGEARTRLEAAVADAGAELALAADPVTADPAEALALAPQAVLVALEPAIEDALERYDALLMDPAVVVVFDEAELAAQRDGWDAARWVRHLAAKLNRHHDVLPPGAEDEHTLHPHPGPLPAREFDGATLDLEAMADTAHELAADVPRADVFADEATDPGLSGLLSVEDMDWSSSAAGGDYDISLADDPALAALLAEQAQATSGDVPSPADVDDGSGFSLVDPEAPAADGVDMAGPDGIDASAEGGTADMLALGDGLSLANDDAPLASRPAVQPVDLDALESRLGGLSLAEFDSYGHGTLRGAVLVEGGLGGPDAVRQLLGNLPEGFPRAVLVRLQLDGGRYDRLVKQMERATPLPVALAEDGQAAEAATIYFLPPELVVVADRARLVFAAVDEHDARDPVAALPAGDSALLFLSGSDPVRAERAMALAMEGALVMAQSPGTCYDAAAADALIARGAAAADPADLAQQLRDRWPS